MTLATVKEAGITFVSLPMVNLWTQVNKGPCCVNTDRSGTLAQLASEHAAGRRTGPALQLIALRWGCTCTCTVVPEAAAAAAAAAAAWLGASPMCQWDACSMSFCKGLIAHERAPPPIHAYRPPNPPLVVEDLQAQAGAPCLCQTVWEGTRPPNRPPMWVSTHRLVAMLSSYRHCSWTPVCVSSACAGACPAAIALTISGALSLCKSCTSAAARA